MAKNQQFISHARTETLKGHLAGLYRCLDSDHTEQEVDELYEEIDAINRELSGRAHDLEDPSSGLGCHQPT